MCRTMENFKRINRELEYKGRIIDFYTDYVKLPDGREVKWDFIQHKGAAAIIPVDSDGKIIMVRQYRNAIDKYTLEIPAGGLNEGEDMKTCATRECEEETGYQADQVEHLVDIHTAVAFCNEKIGIYYSKHLTKTKQNLDDDEYVSIERYNVSELVDLIFSGVIEDSKTISAILAYKTKMGI